MVVCGTTEISVDNDPFMRMILGTLFDDFACESYKDKALKKTGMVILFNGNEKKPGDKSVCCKCGALTRSRFWFCSRCYTREERCKNSKCDRHVTNGKFHGYCSEKCSPKKITKNYVAARVRS